MDIKLNFEKYCDKKSFYGRAYVVSNPNKDYAILYSYNTEICRYNKNTRIFRFLGGLFNFADMNDGKISKTTLRHIRCFFNLISQEFKENSNYTELVNKRKKNTVNDFLLSLTYVDFELRIFDIGTEEKISF